MSENNTAPLQRLLPNVSGHEWPMKVPTETIIPNLPEGHSWPKVSIVTPSYNQGIYLEKTIRSVLLQGYPNLEYIIIDGGSTDQSIDIIRKYEPWIDCWVSENDRGQSHAINKGFDKTTGEILCWLNSDDYFAQDALFKVAEVYTKTPLAGAIVGAGQKIDESGNLVSSADPFDITVESLCRWTERFFWQPSCFFSRQAWEKCGPLDENLHFAMDLDLWFKIAKEYSFASIDAILSTSLMHRKAKTNAFSAQTCIDACFVILKHGGEKEARKTLLSFFSELAQRSIQQNQQIEHLENQIEHLERNIEDLLNSQSWKLTAPLRKIAGSTILRKENKKSAIDSESVSPHQYHAQIKITVQERRPRIVHALENFMTGGSSRLVVDIFEHLGHFYEQEVITKIKPDPPNYVGLPINGYPEISSDKALKYFELFKPDIVHIHYWEEKPFNWYKQVFDAAQKFGCIIIENINTPVKPFFSSTIDHYVYVSDYVYKTFGFSDGKSSVIYPGSNFNLFSRDNSSEISDDVIGMVYRLEPDKLNKLSIEAFIETVKSRPNTKALIVGGGSLLSHFKKRVEESGLVDSFEFTGYVPYERLPELYARMSLFVAPVWKESFGQVSPFAMSMKIPVVGYDIGALGEIINNRDLLAVPNDYDSLTETIIDLLDNREKRLSIGLANQQRAHELFSVEAMVSDYQKLYRELLEKKL